MKANHPRFDVINTRNSKTWCKSKIKMIYLDIRTIHLEYYNNIINKYILGDVDHGSTKHLIATPR